MPNSALEIIRNNSQEFKADSSGKILKSQREGMVVALRTSAEGVLY
jgi:hypothetical protein